MSPLPAGYVTNRGITVKGKPLPFAGLWYQKWVNPIAAATNNLLTTKAGPNTATATYGAGGVAFDGALATAITGAVGVPLDFPRNVVITVTHATSVVALSGTITGFDEYGDLLTEAWSVTAGTTSKTFTGKKAFAVVTSVTVTAVTDASADSVVVGIGQVFGIRVRLSVASAIKETSAGSVVTNGTFVVAGADPADPRGTYSPNTAPDGTKTYEIWVASNDPELS